MLYTCIYMHHIISTIICILIKIICEYKCSHDPGIPGDRSVVCNTHTHTHTPMHAMMMIICIHEKDTLQIMATNKQQSPNLRMPVESVSRRK